MSNDRPEAMKRVLIISYYFPPSGGPGVQRVLKFVKYLPEFGWHPSYVVSNSMADPRVGRQSTAPIPKNREERQQGGWNRHAFGWPDDGRSAGQRPNKRLLL